MGVCSRVRSVTKVTRQTKNEKSNLVVMVIEIKKRHALKKTLYLAF